MEKCKLRFTTQSSSQHAQILTILARKWTLLMGDLIISKYIPEVLPLTFRWAKSLQDNLVHSLFSQMIHKASLNPLVLTNVVLVTTVIGYITAKLLCFQMVKGLHHAK